MLVILPPSETKRIGGNEAFDEAALSHTAALGRARRRVRKALEQLSRGDEDAAAKALGLGVKNRGELDLNRRLVDSPVMPAIERYTGVLYDALDVASLSRASREWVNRHVAVQSALFGLLGASDLIPAYRVSAGSRLAGLGEPLRRVWSGAHAVIDWKRFGFVLDLRSKDYAVLAPLPEHSGAALHVVQRGEDGAVRALNHFNKAAKGELVRRLAEAGADIASRGELLDWAGEEGLEMWEETDASRTVTLCTRLGAPQVSAAG